MATNQGIKRNMDTVLWERGMTPLNKLTFFTVLIMVFFFGLVTFFNPVSAPVTDIYDNFKPGYWDCSNIAAHVFKKEKEAGRFVYIVIGTDKKWENSHAWVENKEGKVIIGGKKEYLYKGYPYRAYHTEIPNEIGGDKTWKFEWTIPKGYECYNY